MSDPRSYEHITRDLDRLSEVRYREAADSALTNDPRSLLLVSIPKSGRTWLLSMLVNYSCQVRNPAHPRVDYEGLGRFTVKRTEVRRGGPLPVLDPAGLHSGLGLEFIAYQHPHHGRLNLDIQEHGGPKVFLHRNVLDFLVSAYHFYFEYRTASAHLASGPRDLIEGYTRYWALCWRFHTEKMRPAGRTITTSYEALKSATEPTVAAIVDWLGNAVDESALRRAIPMASAAHAAADEEALGRTLVAELDRGTFVRDGSVGQWKAHLDTADVAHVRRILGECGVDPEVAIPADA